MISKKTISGKKCVHIFSPGRNIDKTFISAIKKFQIDRVFVFSDLQNKKTDDEEDSKIKSSIEKLRKIGLSIGVPVIDIDVEEDNLIDVRDKILDLRDRYPESTFYFNITGGKKVLSLNLFTMSVWINGSAYYVEKDGTIIEFSIPRIQPESLNPESLKFKVLSIVSKATKDENGFVLYSETFDAFKKVYKPKRENDAGRYPVARKGTFSKLVRALIEEGLLKEGYLKHSHKTKTLSITSDGIFTVNFVKGPPEKNLDENVSRIV
jgi:hypothetical protein